MHIKLCKKCGTPLSPDEGKKSFNGICHKCLHKIFVKGKKKQEEAKDA